MQIQNVGAMSLGEWSAICRVWSKAHGEKNETAPPSEDEFEAAVMAARGV